MVWCGLLCNWASEPATAAWQGINGMLLKGQSVCSAHAAIIVLIQHNAQPQYWLEATLTIQSKASISILQSLVLCHKLWKGKSPGHYTQYSFLSSRKGMMTLFIQNVMLLLHVLCYLPQCLDQLIMIHCPWVVLQIVPHLACARKGLEDNLGF